jgi:undecaprenyl-diphosphatase
MDTAILLWINGLRTPALDGVLGFLGTWGYLFFPVILGGVALRRRDAASLRDLLDGWLAYLLALFWVESLLKPLVDRPRPSAVAALEGTLHVLGRASSSPSFPSGTATACAAAVAWLALRHRADAIDRAVLAATTLLALVISLARLYAGAHWPSDVLAGWIAGAGTAWAIHRLTLVR